LPHDWRPLLATAAGITLKHGRYTHTQYTTTYTTRHARRTRTTTKGAGNTSCMMGTGAACWDVEWNVEKEGEGMLKTLLVLSFQGD